MYCRHLSPLTDLDSEDTKQRKIEYQLSDWYWDVAQAIRQRILEYPHLTDLNGVRLLHEETAEYFEGRATQARRVP